MDNEKGAKDKVEEGMGAPLSGGPKGQ